MTMTAQHTKGRLRQSPPDEFGDIAIAPEDEALAIAAVVTNMRPRSEVQANAARIVHTWNCHDDLLEALIDAQAWLNSAYDEYTELGDRNRKSATIYNAVRPVKEKISAAIAKARGGS